MWQGTDYNEKRFNSVRNGLVGIWLDGVVGISPDRGNGTARKMVPPNDANRILTKATEVYAFLVGQKPPRQAKAWHEHKVKELDGLIRHATAVRDGRAEQKMTAADYEALRKSLSR